VFAYCTRFRSVLAVKASQEQVAATLARSIVLCRGKPSTYEHIHGTLEYFTERECFCIF
jgi:hypothetical protein